jgi:hypothetical protein
VIFGGYQFGTGRLDDTWTFDPTIPSWTKLNLPNNPDPTYLSDMDFDSQNQIGMMFGGNVNTGIINQTWLFGDLYKSKGNFTSGVIDSNPGSTSINWVNLSWTEDLGGGGNIYLMLASNNDNLSWYYVGPDGTVLTTYKSKGGEAIWNGHDGDRYLKYRLFIVNKNPLDTPSVSKVRITLNRIPMAPSLDAPSHNQFVTTMTPTFSFRSYEADPDNLKFKIQLSDDNFNTIFGNFSQVDNQTGWSSQSYTSNQIATYLIQEDQALENGRTYQWRALAWDGRDWSEPSVIWWFTVDTTPPVKPYSVNDGLGEDLDYTNTAESLSAHWDAAADPESGVKSYWYAIGTTPEGTDVLDWTDNGARITVTVEGLQLAHLSTYYFSVKAENGAGLFSGITSSNGVTIDTTLPSTPVIDDGGDYTSSLTSLSAEWYSLDEESGIMNNKYAIGTTQNSTDVVAWTVIGGTNAVTHKDLSLVEGQDYFFFVQTQNNIGEWSDIGYSDGITVDATAPYNLSITINDGADYTNSTDVGLSLSAKDDISGISDMAFSNDGAVWTEWTTFSKEYDWSLSGGDGLKTVHYRARDGAGNIKSGAMDTITLDITPPSSLFLEINDGANLTNSSNVDLTLTAFDTTSGLDKVSFSEDGDLWTSYVDYSRNMLYTLSFVNGEKSLMFKIKDRAGNEAVSEMGYITLDSEPPVNVGLTINNNAAGTMESLVTLTTTAEDSLTGVSMMSFSSDGEFWGAWEPFAETRVYELQGGYGVKTIHMKVMDGAGNEAPAVEDSIAYGMVTLTIKIESPVSREKVKDKVTIKGTATSDSPIMEIEVKIDNGPWKEANGTTSWSYVWDSSDYPEGVHTIQIRGKNDLGYSTSEPIEVIVKHKGETTTTDSGLTWWTIVALLVVIIVLGLFLGFIVGRSGGLHPPTYEEEDYDMDDDYDEPPSKKKNK